METKIEIHYKNGRYEIAKLSNGQYVVLASCQNEVQANELYEIFNRYENQEMKGQKTRGI